MDERGRRGTAQGGPAQAVREEGTPTENPGDRKAAVRARTDALPGGAAEPGEDAAMRQYGGQSLSY